MRRPRGEEPFYQLQEVLDRLNPRKALFSLLYIGLIGFGYSIVLEFPGIRAYVYAMFAIIFTTIMIWVFFDMHTHLTDYHRYEELETDIESKHFLCADPLCDRCRGYWVGLSSTATLTLTLYQKFMELAQLYGIDSRLLAIVGFTLFIGTTPLHGTINSVVRSIFKGLQTESHTTKKRLNFLLGFVSGLSLSATVIGVLLILS